MKHFKLVDILINIALMGWFLTHHWRRDPDALLTAYFTIGGWQVISMIVHEAHKWFTVKYNTRYLYHRISLLSVITIPLGSFWILGFTAPFMAIFYTVLCIVEYFR